MKVHSGFPGKPLPRGSAVTLGVFDGVHVGHRRVLALTVTEARRAGLRSVAVTFRNHPLELLAPLRAPRLISSLPHRLSLLEGTPGGLDACVVVPFTRALSRVSARAFVSRYLVRTLRARVVVAGPDLHFGRGREGNLDVLTRLGDEMGFSVRTVPHAMVGGKPVSSTRVRALIVAGKLREASACLGRPYSTAGPVEHGQRRGRTLGAPTVNVGLGERVYPPEGVWAVRLRVGSRTWRGVANLGRRPTFAGPGGAAATTLEVHVLDRSFASSRDARAAASRRARASAEVWFVRFLRSERRFPSAHALARQIRRDARSAARALRA